MLEKTWNIQAECVVLSGHVIDFIVACEWQCDESERSTPKRKEPEEGYLKINTHGAFRDGSVDDISLCMHKEAEASLQAIIFFADAGMTLLGLETDALELHTALTTMEYDCSPLCTLFREMKFYVDELQSCKSGLYTLFS